MFTEIKRYLLSGIGSNIVNFVIYSFFYSLGIQLFLASLFGYLAGLFMSYTFGRIWVFGERFVSTKRTFISFFLVYAIGGIGMSLLIVISTEFFQFDYRISWIIGALFAVVNNFVGQKYIVFKKGEING